MTVKYYLIQKPPNTFTAKTINTILQTISDGTYNSIPKDIDNYTITRTDHIDEITKTLERENRIVITGNKGTGKSVILCQIYKKLRNKLFYTFSAL